MRERFADETNREINYTKIIKHPLHTYHHVFPEMSRRTVYTLAMESFDAVMLT